MNLFTMYIHMCFHVGTHVLECMCGSLRTIYKDIENKQTNKNKKENLAGIDSLWGLNLGHQAWC